MFGEFHASCTLNILVDFEKAGSLKLPKTVKFGIPTAISILIHWQLIVVSQVVSPPPPHISI
jgi:hypothetical protein